MRYNKLILLFVISCLLSLNTFAKGYKIKVKVNGLSDSTVILAHYFSKQIYPDDTAKLDKNGEGYFKGDKSLPGGMYIVYMPNKKYFDFLVDEKNQEFFVQNDTSAAIDKFVFTNSPMNINFLSYQKFIQDRRKIREKLEKEYKDSTTTKARKEKIQKEVEVISKEVDDNAKKVILQNKDNFLGVFINALQRVEVPDPPKDKNGKVTDSLFQYFYYKQHFFDNFNIQDARLLRTPLYEDKIFEYLENVIPQHPDSINKEVDILLDKSKADSNIFRFMLVKIFNHYAQSNIMGMDAVYIHIGEKYYLKEATWSDSTFIKKLKENIAENKPTLIGQIAPDIEMISIPAEHFQQAANDTALKGFVYVGKKMFLHDIQAPYTILFFWDRDCGHCRKTIPELYKEYEESLKAMGVQVIAFHILFGKEGKVKWVDFINENKFYDWYNVWYPYGYEFKNIYNIKSTPVLFLLDKNKKIIAKRIEPKQVTLMIKDLMKKEERKNSNK